MDQIYQGCIQYKVSNLYRSYLDNTTIHVFPLEYKYMYLYCENCILYFFVLYCIVSFGFSPAANFFKPRILHFLKKWAARENKKFTQKSMHLGDLIKIPKLVLWYMYRNSNTKYNTCIFQNVYCLVLYCIFCVGRRLFQKIRATNNTIQHKCIVLYLYFCIVYNPVY